MTDNKHSEISGSHSETPVKRPDTIGDAIRDNCEDIKRLAAGTEFEPIANSLANEMIEGLEPEKKEDPGQALYGFSARCMQLYAVADLFTQYHENADEVGPAFSLIADEAYRLNDELFTLAGTLKGRDNLTPSDASLLLEMMRDRAEKLTEAECVEQLRRYCWEAHRVMTAGEHEDSHEVRKSWTLLGLQHFVAERDFLERLHISEDANTEVIAEWENIRHKVEPASFDDQHYILLRGIIRAARDVFKEINEPLPSEKCGINEPAVQASCALDSLVDQLERALSPN